MKSRTKSNKKSTGNILLAVIFMLLIFFGGATLLSFTITHSRIIGARTKKIVETGSMVQSLIYHLHHFRNNVFAAQMQNYQAPESQFFNASRFPPQVTSDNLQIVPAFRYFDTLLSGYKKTRVYATFDVFSTSTFRGHQSHYQVKSEVTIDILSGQIPITFFPLFLATQPGIPSQDFLEENHIVDNSAAPIEPGNIEAQVDVVSMAAEALNIPTNPNNKILMWRDIRAKLGLPLLDEPIPQGIYLIVEGTFVRAVFIQGDVEQLTFTISSSSVPHIQEIRFVIKSQTYLLRYKPKEKYFVCWNPIIARDAVFGEKIMVNGAIQSVIQEGDAAFSGYANIMLLVSGRTIISSDLRTEAYHLNVGEIKLTSLTLATGLEQLWGMEAGLHDPALEVNSAEEIDVEASVICAGKFTNNSPQLNLSGSLYCETIENNGEIKITHAESRATSIDSTLNRPAYLRTVDYKFVTQFLIEFIEEVYND